MEHQSPRKGGPRTRWFVVVTGIYLVTIFIGAYLAGFFDRDGIPIGPNEWGDVLAGAASPLAFLWLVYASLSQRAELELQREELAQNNLTQDAQREEMQRQVEALTAQAKLLEAQAAATFDPVFVVRQVHSSRDGYMLAIENRGCEVMNIHMQGEFDIEYYNGGSTGFDRSENEVYYWATDSAVSCQMHAVDHEALHQIAIQYTRKDGAAKRNVYLFDIAKQSLRLVQSDHVMPSIGHK